MGNNELKLGLVLLDRNGREIVRKLVSGEGVSDLSDDANLPLIVIKVLEDSDDFQYDSNWSALLSSGKVKIVRGGELLRTYAKVLESLAPGG